MGDGLATAAGGGVSTDDTLEWRLFDATRLHDLVVRRRLAPDGERIVAYAVPHPDGDLAAARRWLTARGREEGHALSTLLLDRIPRTAGGEIDERALERLPVPDAVLLDAHERALRADLGLAGAAVRLEPAPPPPPPPPRGADDARRAGARPAHARGPTVALPADAPATLGEALAASARRHPAHGVIAYDEHGVATTLRYPELLARGLRVAGGLHERGIAPGERVLLQAPELADYFPALWGCLLAGARPVTLQAPTGYERRSATLDKLHAAWSSSGRPWIVAAGAAVAGLRRVETLYGDAAPRIADAGACAEATPLDAPLDGGEVALLQLSSGTTGRSKQIEIAHRAVPSLALACERDLGCAADHVSVNWLPLDHVVPLVFHHLRDVVLGATNVHAPTARVVAEPLRWLDLLERHGAQHTWSPNFGYRLVADALADAPPGRAWDLTRLRTFVNGGEQCTLPVIERFLAATARFGVQPGQMRLIWGMAELGTALTIKRFDAPGAVRRAGSGTFLSMGPPHPNSELRIVGDDGGELREGEIGRLLARSDRLTPGYLVDGVRQPVTDADGWFDTGDLGFLEDGELVITGRAKELIVINGANLFAHEVEDAVAGLPGIADGLVAACGVPDAARGTEALAVLYVAADDAPREQLEARIRAAAAGATGIAPMLVRAVSAERFARTTSGKVQRTLLRERLLAGELGPVPGDVDAGERAAACDAAFEPCWIPLRRAPRAPLLRPPTLVVRADGDDGDELLDELRRLGLVREHVELHAAAAEALDAAGSPPPGSVLFLASRVPDAAGRAATAPGARAYLALARALLARGFSGEVLSVSRGLHASDDAAAAPAASPLAALTDGLALGLSGEAAGIDAWHVDLPGSSPVQDARALHSAAATRRAERSVAWREGSLHVRRLRAHALPAGDAGEPLLAGRAVLATGGLGGLGRELLGELLADGAADARVLVVGRGALDAPAADASRAAFARLAARCGELRYRALAVEDEDALRGAVGEAERDWGVPITVALHCAGVYAERPLEALDAGAWAEQVAGRADGLINLARLLRERDGATLLVASSVLGEVGSAHSAAYIAASRFAETCTERLRREGLDVRCVSWSAWSGVGMRARIGLDAHVARRGMLALAPAAARALARRAYGRPGSVRAIGLDAAHPRVRGMLADGPVHPLERVVVELPAGANGAAPPLVRDPWGRPLAQRVVHARAASAPNADAPRGPEGEAVAAVFGALVDGPLPLERPFAELGLGSLELIRAHAELERRLDRAIDRTLLFELPTPRALAQRLAADAPEPRPAAAAAARERDELRDAVAIVGAALRLPGARTPEDYWRLLREGRCAVRRFEPAELLAAGVAADVVADPDFVPVTGALDDVERFAPEAFGMSVREASLTAPQQRLLLEVVHELLAVAGYEQQAQEAEVGVFAGTGMHLYGLNSYLVSTVLPGIQVRDPVLGIQVAVGNEPDFAASRIAFRLGLTGPAVGVQTACSTALSAVHLACRSLQAGDCDAAVAAAGAIHVPHPNGYLYREGSILSPSGSCRAFDARADGTVGGNGVAAVLLKPLARARADGDAIQAVIRGSAINNDGARKPGFTAPSVEGQRAVVGRALAAAGVRADELAYVQAHGTGTPIGDPIEVRALTRAFADDGARRRGACVLGSVKPNIGHLDSCAGLAGLIATLLALRHGEAPPQINYAAPNPALGLDDGPFRIVREPTPLVPSDGAPLRAGVSALGVGGTNVHVVLEQAR